MAQNYIEGSEPIPGYRLVRFLGEGGFGKVWKATAPGGTEVALKIIQLGGIQGRKEFRALQRVKRIRHPNLIPVTAFWLKNRDGEILDDALTDQDHLPTGDTTDGPPLTATLAAPVPSSGDRPTELIIAMGLGDGNLFTRLEECRVEGLDGIPVDELLGYMEHSAEGLDFLHRPIHQFDAGKGSIQHCDIKPHNLLVVGGAVEICDFGLARVMGAGQTTTDSASTIAYVAPEFLKDGVPSPTTDQYSLAISYFELRTGTLPYATTTFVGVTKAVMEGALELSQLPLAERDVIRKATSIDPSKRFETISEMVRALRDAVDGTSVATPDRLPGRGIGCGTILTIAVVVVLVLSIALLAVRRYAPERIPSLPPFLEWLEPDKVDESDKVDEPNEDKPDKDDNLPVHQDHHGGKTSADDPHPVQSQNAVSATSKESIDALCERIALLIDSAQAESYREAIERVDEAIGRGEQDGRLWRLRGLAYLGLKDPDQAVADFTESFDKTADLVDRVHRGEAYYQQGKDDEAMADFKTAITHFEANLSTASNEARKPYAAAYLGRGTILFIQGDVQAAIEQLKAGIAHDPKDFRFYSRLGSFHLIRKTAKDWQLAVDYLNQAIALKPSDLDYINLGRASMKLSDFEHAQAAFDSAIQLTPGNADAYYLSGDCYLKQSLQQTEKRYDLAIARFTPAIDNYESYKQEEGDPLFDLPHAYYYRTTCYLAIGKLDEAANDLKSLVKEPADLPVEELIGTLADAMAELGRYDEAIQWIQQAIKQAPEANRQPYREKLQRYESEATR